MKGDQQHINDVEYLVVGQGICGTLLSYYLHKENKRFLVMDPGELLTPSKLAAGVINPVTGRRLVRVWLDEQILPFAHHAYRELAAMLGIETIVQKNIIDFFPNPHQRQVFMERIEEGEEYLHSYPEQNQFNSFLQYDFGCGEIRHSYLVRLEKLLPAWRAFLKSNQQLLEQSIDINALTVGEEGIRCNGITAEKIIFCDGLNSFQNPFFKQLPFAPNKGEMLTLEIDGLPADHIYKKGFLLVPLQENNKFWFGSNYQWKFDHVHPTKEFYEQAERHLNAWLKLPFKILDHQAALRPATLERRPFVGIHPHQKNIAILNGMGTKGTSLAPFFAQQLVKHLVGQAEIMPQADIKRFSKILAK